MRFFGSIFNPAKPTPDGRKKPPQPPGGGGPGPSPTAPAAPLIGTATAGYQSASVTFTAQGTGGSPITSFIVTSSPGGLTGSGSASPVTVAGLTNGVPYTFTVQAVNAIGTSPASAASNSVTPNTPTVVPGPPLNVVGTRGNAQASIAFSAPTSNGGASITSYTVTLSPGSLTFSGGSSPIVATGLVNGTSYTATVTATNSVGEGPASAASAAFVPATVPSAPIIGTATAGNALAQVSFTAPASNGGLSITGYVVTANPGGLTASGPNSPLTVLGLTNGIGYTFTVTASNAIGTSTPSGVSNQVTPSVPVVNAGPFDQYYNPTFELDDTDTFYSTPAESFPAKSTGYADESYIDQRFGTRIYRMLDAADLPGSDASLRHEYARKQAFNCDGTKVLMKNSSGYFFCFNASTFALIPGANTVSANATGAIGVNTAFPRDPCEMNWHPTNPDIVFHTHDQVAGGLVFYAYNTATNTSSVAFSFVGRLAAFGMGSATRVTTEGDGRCSDNGRYWGFSVRNGSTFLGIMTYDRETDTIIAARACTGGNTPGSLTMSPNGNWLMVGAFVTGMSLTACRNAGINSLYGTRCYSRDLTTFVQVHCTSLHAEMAVDDVGNDVYVSFNYSGSLMPDVEDGWTFYRRLNDGVAVQIWDLYDGAEGGHVSSCCSPGHPGWVVFSTYQSAAEATWRDGVVMLQELKASGARHLRVCHTRKGWSSGDYWAEPHATCDRSGLRVIWAAKFSGQPPISHMVGLPSWAYGTPAAISFDPFYASDFELDEGTTFIATPAQTLPAKSTGYASPSYVESVLGTRVYRMAQASDMPGTDTKLRHEYARKQMFNCDGTRYMLINSADYLFCYDAQTFARVPGHMTLNSNSTGAMGSNTTFPRSPGETHWSATNPNRIIFAPGVAGGLTFYEYDIISGAVTQKFSLVGRLAAYGMGSATAVYTGGEGRPSDDGRFWGFGVYNGSTWLGICVYDMQNDTIVAARAMTGSAPNNVTMSPTGNYINVSSFEASLTMSQCAAAGLTVQRGSRCYPRDLNSFVQVHCTSAHSEMAVDTAGNDVFVGFQYTGSRMPDVTDGMTFYRIVSTGVAVELFDLYAGGHGGHVSSCNTQGKPGWVLFSMYQTETESTWRDNMVFLQELTDTSPRHLRVAHTLAGYQSGQYWTEPHGTISRDGLKVVWAAEFSGGLDSYAMMAGLPTWAYVGAAQPGGVPVNSVLPTISQNGSILTATTGTWTNTPSSFAYQWQREDPGPIWTNVGSSGNNTHSVGNFAKNYRCEVTATNAAGAGTPATSDPFDPVDPTTDLFDNGAFAADTDWTKGSGWTIAGGKAVRVPDAGSTSLSQTVTLNIGATYRFGVTVDSMSAGSFQFRITGGTTVASGTISGTGYKEVDIVPTSGSTSVELLGNAALNATFDNAVLNTYSQPAGGAGAERLLNGGFDDASSWTLGTGWAIASGVATHSGGVDGNLDQALVGLITGNTYRVLLTVSGYTGSDACAVSFTGGTPVVAQEIRSNGQKHYDIVAASGNNNFRISGAGSMSFDAISVRQLAAEQLITNGDFAADSDWTKGTGWSIGSGVATHVSGSTSDLSQSQPTLVVGRDYLAKVTVTASSGEADMSVRLIGGASASVSPPFRIAQTYWHVLRAKTGNNLVGARVSSTVTSASFDDYSLELLPVGYNLIQNPQFATTDYWMNGTAGKWAITGNAATVAIAPGSAANFYHSLLFEGGATYRIAFTMTRSAGSLTIRLSGGLNAVVNSSAYSASGSYSVDLVANADQDAINLRADGSFVGTVTSVTVTKL